MLQPSFPLLVTAVHLCMPHGFLTSLHSYCCSPVYASWLPYLAAFLLLSTCVCLMASLLRCILTAVLLCMPHGFLTSLHSYCCPPVYASWLPYFAAFLLLFTCVCLMASLPRCILTAVNLCMPHGFLTSLYSYCCPPVYASWLPYFAAFLLLFTCVCLMASLPRCILTTVNLCMPHGFLTSLHSYCCPPVYASWLPYFAAFLLLFTCVCLMASLLHCILTTAVNLYLPHGFLTSLHSYCCCPPVYASWLPYLAAFLLLLFTCVCLMASLPRCILTTAVLLCMPHGFLTSLHSYCCPPVYASWLPYLSAFLLLLSTCVCLMASLPRCILTTAVHLCMPHGFLTSLHSYYCCPPVYASWLPYLTAFLLLSTCVCLMAPLPRCILTAVHLCMPHGFLTSLHSYCCPPVYASWLPYFAAFLLLSSCVCLMASLPRCILTAVDLCMPHGFLTSLHSYCCPPVYASWLPYFAAFLLLSTCVCLMASLLRCILTAVDLCMPHGFLTSLHSYCCPPVYASWLPYLAAFLLLSTFVCLVASLPRCILTAVHLCMSHDFLTSLHSYCCPPVYASWLPYFAAFLLLSTCVCLMVSLLHCILTAVLLCMPHGFLTSLHSYCCPPVYASWFPYFTAFLLLSSCVCLMTSLPRCILTAVHLWMHHGFLTSLHSYCCPPVYASWLPYFTAFLLLSSCVCLMTSLPRCILTAVHLCMPHGFLTSLHSYCCPPVYASWLPYLAAFLLLSTFVCLMTSLPRCILTAVHLCMPHGFLTSLHSYCCPPVYASWFPYFTAFLLLSSCVCLMVSLLHCILTAVLLCMPHDFLTSLHSYCCPPVYAS